MTIMAPLLMRGRRSTQEVFRGRWQPVTAAVVWMITLASFSRALGLASRFAFYVECITCLGGGSPTSDPDTGIPVRIVCVGGGRRRVRLGQAARGRARGHLWVCSSTGQLSGQQGLSPTGDLQGLFRTCISVITPRVGELGYVCASSSPSLAGRRLLWGVTSWPLLACLAPRPPG